MFNKKSQIELKKDLDKESFKRITCSFYRYVNIMNAEEFRNRLYQKFSHLNILGRIYVANEGINAQISIPEHNWTIFKDYVNSCLLYTSPSPRDQRGSRMPCCA